jgi:hypothetical protein
MQCGSNIVPLLPVEDEVAHLRDLDLKGLRARGKAFSSDGHRLLARMETMRFNSFHC